MVITNKVVSTDIKAGFRLLQTEAHAHLLIGSHETSLIVWTGKPARTRDTVLEIIRVLKVDSHAIRWVRKLAIVWY